METSDTKASRWLQRWGYTISKTPLPGVFRKKEGGYLVRVRIVDPRTHKLRQVMRSLDANSPAEALAAVEAEAERMRNGSGLQQPSAMLFATWSASLLRRKVTRGELRSAASIEKWGGTIPRLVEHFGMMPMPNIRRADIEAWKDKVAEQIEAGDYKPTTANGWLSILKVIISTFVAEHELDRDPCLKVKPFDTRGHRTYTEEQPNSLTTGELREFLDTFVRRFAQHYAMTVLGFVTGLRPSSLRPLRRQGPSSDVLWNEGVILVRRSHSRAGSIMDLTKTGRDQRIALPPEIMELLRWHIDLQIPEDVPSDCELLFPAADGGVRSTHVLKKPFAEVTKALSFKKRLTPRAMRRTFQDLARAAEIRDLITRSISGHATEAMQRRYSTVQAEEQRAAIAQVVDLAGVRAARSGVTGGVRAPGETTSAAGVAST
jgi:integrase